MRIAASIVILFLSSALMMFAAPAEVPPANYDETKIPPYTLPDPLVLSSGAKVTDAKIWQKKRRAEVLELFRSQVYGRSPKRPPGMKFQVKSEDPKALDGKATRKEVSVLFTGKADGPKMDILMYLPNGSGKPVPAFVGLNFGGNQSIHKDPGISITRSWIANNKQYGITNHEATEATRETEGSRWAVEKILDRGFALATIYCGDIDPDFHDGFTNGVHAIYENPGKPRPDDAWGTIAAWAWGLSRAMDYFETDKAIDAKKVAVIGHSRLGKTASWARAEDERFAIVISNDSGCGG